MIRVLDKNTIDQIAAGEVVERPMSVVKELCENAVDAGATAITVEIKDGGISLIRVTDNGSGIDASEVKTAFLRHATSKIRSALDLMNISSLGFRGEALSSIASVAKVELLTKTSDSFTGTRYVIEGGEEKALEEAGCPDGTTFLVRDLFFNTPVRRKFLKSQTTETGYVAELIEKLSLCNPTVSFKFISNGKVISHTSGNGKINDIILELYGSDFARAIVPIEAEDAENGLSLSGLILKPYISKGNRSLECCFVNGRYVKSKALQSALEDGFKGYMMGHNYPVSVMYLTVPHDFVDVNVHPQKMELKFTDSEAVYRMTYNAVRDALSGKNLIVKASAETEAELKKEALERKEELNKVHIPEPFEIKKEKPAEPVKRVSEYAAKISGVKPGPEVSPEVAKVPEIKEYTNKIADNTRYDSLSKINNPETDDIIHADPDQKITGYPNMNDINKISEEVRGKENEEGKNPAAPVIEAPKQTELPLDLYREKKKEYKLIGQVFKTYWIIEMDNTMFIIDQHAAHEKVLYERTMKRIREKERFLSQALMPAEILSLSLREAEALRNNVEFFEKLGFEISEFGGNDFKLTGVPAELVDINYDDLFKEILSSILSERDHSSPELMLDRIATISCKAAVKGNNTLSFEEADKLISDMLELENPYHCPHGRPTTISFTKDELEKKFKRVL